MYSEFIEINNQRLFACWSQKERKSDVLTLIIPPFAEEMNKCRHLFSLLRQQFNAKSDMLLLDPFGTGDSDGDLVDTTAQQWASDWHSVVALAGKAGYQKINLLAARFGALQMFDILQQELPLPLNKIVLWQPYLQSSTFLQQFFRLKIAEQMATGNKTTQKELEQQLSTGEVLEIAGYPITQNFVSSIHALKDVASLPALYQQTPLLWLETSMLPNISPVCEKGMALLSQYFAAEFTQLQGPAWWNATELVQSPELIARSVEFLTGKTA